MSFKQTKFDFESMFSLLWTKTPVHFAGQELNARGLAEWVNPYFTPLSGSNVGLGGAVQHRSMFNIVCWAESDVDVMDLSDEVREFVVANVDGDVYRLTGYEVSDHGWQESNKVYLELSFIVTELKICSTQSSPIVGDDWVDENGNPWVDEHTNKWRTK